MLSLFGKCISLKISSERYRSVFHGSLTKLHERFMPIIDKVISFHNSWQPLPNLFRKVVWEYHQSK